MMVILGVRTELALIVFSCPDVSGTVTPASLMVSDRPRVRG